MLRHPVDYSALAHTVSQLGTDYKNTLTNFNISLCIYSWNWTPALVLPTKHPTTVSEESLKRTSTHHTMEPSSIQATLSPHLLHARQPPTVLERRWPWNKAFPYVCQSATAGSVGAHRTFTIDQTASCIMLHIIIYAERLGKQISNRCLEKEL